jgi:hypothetical protein
VCPYFRQRERCQRGERKKEEDDEEGIKRFKTKMADAIIECEDLKLDLKLKFLVKAFFFIKCGMQT